MSNITLNEIYERIYNVSPIRVQNTFISYYGKKLFKQRYGAEYHSALNYYKNKNYSIIEGEMELQLQELRKLLTYALKNSVYYQRKYGGIDISNIKTIDDLQKLPILEKETLRENIQDVYTIQKKNAIEANTGGTTGKSLSVRFTSRDVQRRNAYLDAFKFRCGVNPFAEKIATFSGRTIVKGIFQQKRKIFWRENSSHRQRLYSTFHLLEENMPYYIDDLNVYTPGIINGFVSAIFQIAQFSIQNKLDIKFRPKAIFTTSETLLPFHRSVIETAFSARIYNQYASAEGAPFITECIEGNLHYNIDTGVIESQDFSGGPEILVTSFTTYGTPLIRYRIGDNVTFQSGSCSCGNCHPLVKSIEGRKVDYLYSKDGGKVSLSQLADVIKGIPNCIKEIQFIQKELDKITIMIVADRNNYDESATEKIIDSMTYRFGHSTSLFLEFVDSIPRESSGKFSLIKNLIASE